MTSSDSYSFKYMVVAFGAVALIGTVIASEANPRFDRISLRLARKRVQPPAVITPTPGPTPVVVADPTPVYTESSLIPSNFDVNSELLSAWGSGNIPASAAPDVVGAFRFICNAGQLISDDPIVYPNQPGKSHLHQFFGNTSTNASSTYASLRQSGTSTCMSPVNRSGYWMPAMLDGQGSVVRPDYISIYYKRRPITDPKCSLTSGDPKAEGNCVSLPNGLRFVFGRDMMNPGGPSTGSAYFNCTGATATSGKYSTITAALANCPSKPNPDGSYNKLGAVISAPTCWDGKNLDTPDHRSHVAYADYGSWGYLKCPATHPNVIPAFTMGVWYTVDENLGTWRLSSDEMMPGTTPGSTLHADWFGAWDNGVQAMWMDNCINKLLNCSGGDLGNGMQMKNFSGFSWTASPRLVPRPS